MARFEAPKPHAAFDFVFSLEFFYFLQKSGRGGFQAPLAKQWEGPGPHSYSSIYGPPHTPELMPLPRGLVVSPPLPRNN